MEASSASKKRPRGLTGDGKAEARTGHQMTLRKRARTEGMTPTTSPPQVGPVKSKGSGSISTSEEGSGTGQNRPHPLLIPVVLRRLFELCGPKVADLKSYRLVCKSWEEATLDQWRKHGVVKLLPDDSSLKRENGTGILIRDFARLIANKKQKERLKLQTNPFGSFRLKGFQISRQECIRSYELFYRAWKALGPSINSLHLTACTFELKEMNKLLAPAVNLKDVTFTENEIGHRAGPILDVTVRPKAITADFIMATKVFPNDEVEEINWISPFPSNIMYTTGTFGILEKMMEDGNRKKGFENLRRLDAIHIPGFAMCYTYQQHLDLIAPLKLHLEYLAVRMHRFMFGAECTYEEQLRVLVTTFHDTLHTFKVLCDPLPDEGSEPSDQFPFGVQMTKMKNLYLWGNATSSLHFLKFMPHLELVHISTYCFDKLNYDDEVWSIGFSPYRGNCGTQFTRAFQIDLVQNVHDLGFDMTGVTMTSLTNLYIDCPLSIDSIETLGIWMPHLKSLKIYVESGAHLRKVCETWPDLEELVLLRESLIHDEDVITGLVNLKHLRRFEVEFRCSCNPKALTEEAIYNGFLKMDSLRSVTIPVVPRMRQKAVDALKAKWFLFSAQVIRKREPCRHHLFKSWIRAEDGDV